MKALSFLCNNCGKESLPNIDSCPHCGSAFSNVVYCLQCEYEADEKYFHDGCPKCGYMSKNKNSKNRSQANQANIKAKAKKLHNNNFSFKAISIAILVLLLIFFLIWFYDIIISG